MTVCCCVRCRRSLSKVLIFTVTKKLREQIMLRCKQAAENLKPQIDSRRTQTGKNTESQEGQLGPISQAGTSSTELQPERYIFYKEGAAIETNSKMPETMKVSFSAAFRLKISQIVRCLRK